MEVTTGPLFEKNNQNPLDPWVVYLPAWMLQFYGTCQCRYIYIYTYMDPMGNISNPIIIPSNRRIRFFLRPSVWDASNSTVGSWKKRQQRWRVEKHRKFLVEIPPKPRGFGYESKNPLPILEELIILDMLIFRKLDSREDTVTALRPAWCRGYLLRHEHFAQTPVL